MAKKKSKIPKKIAGVKLPKAARKQAEKAIEELKQPIVREMIAGAIGMAASAMAKQVAANAAKASQKAELKPEPVKKAEAAKPAESKSGGDQFAEIATGLAMAGLGKLFEKMSAAASEAAKGGDKKN